MQQGLVLDMMGQLTEANKTILEMSMKCATLKKELDMEKKYKQLSIDHAVAQAKWDWEAQWQRVEELQARAASSAAAQPGSKPPPPPGFAPPPESGYPYPVGYGYPTQQAGTNSLAVFSLVASVVGLLCGLGSLVGIVLGAIAISQIKRTRQGGYGLAVAGIVVGVASLVISVVWMTTYAFN